MMFKIAMRLGAIGVMLCTPVGAGFARGGGGGHPGGGGGIREAADLISPDISAAAVTRAEAARISRHISAAGTPEAAARIFMPDPPRRSLTCMAAVHMGSVNMGSVPIPSVPAGPALTSPRRRSIISTRRRGISVPECTAISPPAPGRLRRVADLQPTLRSARS